jgi:hypothetical protein
MLLLCLLPRAGRADCAKQAGDLRAHLIDARHNAGTWNAVWRWGYTAGAVGSFALAATDALPSLTDGLYVSGGKATIAALSRWVMPLRVHVPDQLPDACADLAALHLELAKVAKQERGMFFLTHVGAIVLNGIGAAILWKYDDGRQAALSFAGGYPIGLISNYTMPRASWHHERDHDWTVTITPTHEGGWFAGVAGEL